MTIAIMIVAFVVLVGLDVWLHYSGRETYSERIKLWGRVWPPARLIISLALGVLAGHWFW